MNYRNDETGKSDIIIYTTEDGLSKIETTFDGDDTVWLSIDQMAELFQMKAGMNIYTNPVWRM